MVQDKDEKVLDFFDRVNRAAWLLKRDWPPTPTGGDADAHKKAKKTAVEFDTKVLFTKGLLSHIREEVIIKNPDSLADLKAIALQVEASTQDRQKAVFPTPTK